MTAFFALLQRLLPTLAAKIAAGLSLALLLALIVLRIQMGGLNNRIEHLDGQIAALNRDLGTCRANTATLQAGIAAQNSALERVQAQGATRVAELERSLSTARISAQTAQSRADAILARRPTNPGRCDDAETLALIRGE